MSYGSEEERRYETDSDQLCDDDVRRVLAEVDAARQLLEAVMRESTRLPVHSSVVKAAAVLANLRQEHAPPKTSLALARAANGDWCLTIFRGPEDTVGRTVRFTTYAPDLRPEHEHVPRALLILYRALGHEPDPNAEVARELMTEIGKLEDIAEARRIERDRANSLRDQALETLALNTLNHARDRIQKELDAATVHVPSVHFAIDLVRRSASLAAETGERLPAVRRHLMMAAGVALRAVQLIDATDEAVLRANPHGGCVEHAIAPSLTCLECENIVRARVAARDRGVEP